MHKASCPQCQLTVDRVKTESMPVYDASTIRWKGVAFLCPNCHTILGTSFLPEEIISKEERSAMLNMSKLKMHI
jgi:hypothetical protein